MSDSMVRTDPLHDQVDEICYDLALILRRVLDLDQTEELSDDESSDD